MNYEVELPCKCHEVVWRSGGITLPIRNLTEVKSYNVTRNMQGQGQGMQQDMERKIVLSNFQSQNMNQKVFKHEMNLHKIQNEDVEQIRLAEVEDQWWALAYTVTVLHILQRGEIS